MTLTISPPCLESTEFLLSAETCLLRYLPWTKETPLREWGSSWAAGAALILPILPSLVSPGVWTHPAHRLVSHIRRGLLEAEINQEIPMHTQKERTQGYLGGIGEGTWPRMELPCYISVPLGKGPEASRGVPEATLTAFPHTQLGSSPESLASRKGQTAKYLGCPRTC